MPEEDAIADNSNKPSGDFVKPVIAKTENQKRYIRAITENTIIICNGPAGCGKTCIACGMAANLIKKENNGIERIILTRPVVESSNSIGYLPGILEEKVAPYLVPLLEELKNYISHTLLKTWQNATPKIIEIVPINFIRGRNFHNSIIILDEAANATIEELKLVLTRLGRNSKIIINGDVEQSDLPKFAQGGLAHLISRLEGMSEVAICEMENRDIVRNPLIGEILDRLK